MKDKKFRKRYISKWYVVRMSSKNSPSKFLANYAFFRSKKTADIYTAVLDKHPYNEVKQFTIKASKSGELNRFLHNVENAVTIAKNSVEAVTMITYSGLER